MVWLKSVGKWDLENQERVLARIFGLLASSAEEWRARVQAATSAPEAKRMAPAPDDPPSQPPQRDS